VGACVCMWVWIWLWVHVCGDIISFCCLSLLLRSHLELRLSFLSVYWHFFPPHCPSDLHHLFSISVSLYLSLPLSVSFHSLFFDPILSSCMVTAQPNLVPVNQLVVLLLVVKFFSLFTDRKQSGITCVLFSAGPKIHCSCILNITQITTAKSARFHSTMGIFLALLLK